MELKKMDLTSASGSQLNLEALYQIMPSAFTEVRDDKTGEIAHKINFNTLRELLGDNAYEGADEEYGFKWVGKNAARREAARPINKTLRPCPEESVDWENTQNLYIEGDNLEVLKLLQKSYLGKVKMIYIDPPYNTGNDFVYVDNFDRSNFEENLANGNVDEFNNCYRKNSDSNARFHSDWCSMIYERLLISRSLLSEDGVIFISIDDNEVENLRKLCDDVFGERNFVAQMIWQQGKKSSGNLMNVNHEYVIVYVKNRLISDTSESSWKQRKEGLDKIYSQYETLKKMYGSDCAKIQTEIRKFFVSLPENDPAYNSKHYNFVDEKGLFFADNSCAPDKPESRCHKPLIHPITKKATAVPSLGWRWKEETLDRMVEEDRIYFGTDEKQVPKVKKYLKEMEYELPSTVFYKDGRGASKRLEVLFGKKIFDFPKDENVIKSFVNMVTSNDNSIILDFFSGSATTAHAVMQLNADDGGNRKFIMVQLPEKTEEKSEAYKAGYKNICEIGKERIRRAGKKIKEEAGLEAQNLDTGFRVFKCEDSFMNNVYFSPNDLSQADLFSQVSNIKDGTTDLSLLFGCMLDWGVQLSLPLSNFEVSGKTIYNVNDGDLVACFAEDVNKEVITAIAEFMPLRVVFRDSCFSDAPLKMNLFELFKQKCGWSEEVVKNRVHVI